ncbi:hypothetical protein RN001_013450 [Aquatica leii]|uniref:Ubiquitin carboxyl-terminal hydrolase n=1 Tax=Aquatica leii TaxID=1421715 RepID=A0AAN7NWD8_9COLE|nr:hypothetical protein RN001_013450 [Aquatica leii]
MGKKKRQGEPNRNTDDSSDSCDENQNMNVCPHIKQSVDMPKLRKTLQFHVECDKCKNTISNELDMDGDYEFDLSLWMCLKCGHQGCGRSKNKHALEHFNIPRSDCHSLCVNTMNWNVWCYKCDNEININTKKNLLECVEYLKKQAELSRNKTKSEVAIHQNSDIIKMDNIDCKEFGAPINLLRTRGLRNLGNTCFFNSVMQCLGQTPYLLSLLEETCLSGQYFQLPGGKISPEDSNSIDVEPLDGNLEEWGPLTQVLARTLKELQDGQPDVINPSMLFSRLTHRMPQFSGGHQHDSHELLRHMLEAVREEDLRRYQAVILEKMGLSRKTDPSSVEGDKKKIIKFYGQQASELLLPTEQVFRGVLVSTLRCQECSHTSQRDEFFLDLSLPISEKQIPPVLRRKAEESDDNKPSKHQTKKEKRAAKKKKKQKERNDSAMDSTLQNESESESDADIEDNVEDNMKNDKGGESGYNSVKTETGTPNEDSTEMRIDDNVNSSMGMLCASPLAPDSLENSRASSETNIDMGSPLCGNNSPLEDTTEDYDRPESRLSFVNNKNIDIKADLEKLTLFNDTESKRNDNFYNRCEENQDEEMGEDYDVDVWSNTITTRYQCVEGECSVQSCLNQFTTCELLTENNKVRCDICTKNRGGNDKKTVYTNATKQLLICNPPAVLILHLKRFQVFRFRSTKVNKLVKFPTLLDLAPFCSKRCQDLPTFEQGQSKILYTLFGVVEHSGSLHGGHYVAYVKVRPPLQNQSYRWQYLPKNHKNYQSSRVKGAEANLDVPTGKWFYVSDSYVMEVAENKVLNAQAYLLFYERIL